MRVALFFILILQNISFSQDNVKFEDNIDTTPWPVLWACTLPAYPSLLQEAGIGGRATAQVYVNDEGAVDSVKIIRAAPAKLGLEENVTAAVLSWKFNPAKRQNVSVASATQMTFRFYIARLSKFEESDEEIARAMAIHDSTRLEHAHDNMLVNYQPPPIVQFISEQRFIKCEN